jgi:ankyrin repeat protein
MTPLHYAILSGTQRQIKDILACDNVDVNVLDKSGKHGIHFAAISKRVEIVEFVASVTNVPIDIQDSWEGSTCLHIAAKDGNLSLAELLLRLNASRDILDKYGRSAKEVGKHS